MKAFSTGEVESLLGLPASTLRHWEREVAFLAPRKDVFGRRIYTALDLCTLARLKHLALVRGFGLKKATGLLEQHMMTADPDLKAELNELKALLFSYSADLKALGSDPWLARTDDHAPEGAPADVSRQYEEPLRFS
jgi:DNA-binding transcriptional MerR regulator